MKIFSNKIVRIRDLRHHAAPVPAHARAEDLLCDLAGRAILEGAMYHRRQRNRDKPGAFIQERCTPEERALLAKLVSNPNASMHEMMRFERHLGHPDNKVGGVLEWSPPTVWKVGL